MSDKVLKSFLLWFLVCGILACVFFVIDSVDDPLRQQIIWRPIGEPPPEQPPEPTYVRVVHYTWSPIATTIVFILYFNIFTAVSLRYYVERHGRNVVRWTVACIIFTPILAGVAYLLTWPKDKPLRG